MVGLIDIAPACLYAKVDVGGSEVEVKGVSARGVASLFIRFPEFRKLFTGRSVETDNLLAIGGDFVGALIAAGCGYPGDEKAEGIANDLSVGSQADLIEAILRLTMPQGPVPFFEKVNKILKLVGVDAEASSMAPDTTLQKPSSDSAPAPASRGKSSGK